MRHLAFLVPLMVALPVAAQTPPTPDTIMAAAVNEFIRPGFAELATETETLAGAMAGLCATPSAATLETAKTAFAGVAVSYGRIEFLRIGPLMQANRTDRLLFFPDRKGIALRQVQAILAGDDASNTDATVLATKSVAVQGLTALEFVLYGTDAETLTTADGAFRCGYGNAIAQNMANIARDMTAEWNADGGTADHLMHPKPEYADYRTETEALEQLVGLVAHGVEAVRDARLNPFIAKGEAPAKPKQAIFWRSNLTVPMFEANLSGLADIMSRSAVARAVPEAHKDLYDAIQAEFAKGMEAGGVITSPVEQAVDDPAQAKGFVDMVEVTRNLQALIGDTLSTALGLSVGFSSMDGD